MRAVSTRHLQDTRDIRYIQYLQMRQLLQRLCQHATLDMDTPIEIEVAQVRHGLSDPLDRARPNRTPRELQHAQRWYE